jgi:hypothetical protein
MGSYHRGGTFKSVIAELSHARYDTKVYPITKYDKVLLLHTSFQEVMK